MQLPPFGAFKPLCRGVPSYTWCNLFFRQVSACSRPRPEIYAHLVLLPQLAHKSPETLTGLSANAATAPVGINPQCGIPRAVSSAPGTSHLGNIADVLSCALCFLFALFLVRHAGKRNAAVGKYSSRTSRAIFPADISC